MNIKKIIPIIIVFLIMSTFYTLVFYHTPVKSQRLGPPEKVQVWFSSDWHSGAYSYDIDDVNDNMNITLAFAIGDMVHTGDVQSHWDTFHTDWDAITGTGTIIYRNYTHGNHEHWYWVESCSGINIYDYAHWINRSRLTPTYESGMGNFSAYLNNTHQGPNYTYSYGNLLFIMLGQDFRTCVGGEDVFAIEGWVDWLNTTIQNNQDKNIIILQHLGIETGLQEYMYGLQEQDEIYWMMDNYNVFAWIHGHTHAPPSIVIKNSTYHICNGKFSGSHYDSIMFNFTNGSDIVNVVIRNHNPGSESWDETIGAFDTITLDYSFNAYQQEDENAPHFVSIDGGINGTSTNDSTPTFEWSKTPYATNYHLQIATDSGFSSLVVDLNDINEVNYPTEYDDTGTNVTFILPDSEALSSYTTYYTRVRGYFIN